MTYLGGAGISPCLWRGVPVVCSNHCLLLMHGISPWVPERMPGPSWQTPGHCLGWEPPWVLATRLACLTAVCTTGSTWCSSGGRLRHWGLLEAVPYSYASQWCLFSSQECLDMGVERGQACQILLFWCGPVRWVACSLFVPNAFRWGSSMLASLSGLLSANDWAKVTHHLDWERLGDWTHLLVDSPHVWCCLGDFGLMTHSVGSSLMAAWVSVASWALVTARALATVA